MEVHVPRFRLPPVVLLALGLVLPGQAAAAEFPTVVRAILDRQADGPLAEMDPARRGEMTDCVIETLAALPDGFKDKIVEGKDIEEQEDLFGEVVDANRAEWRQTIASACGHIATAG